MLILHNSLSARAASRHLCAESVNFTSFVLAARYLLPTATERARPTHIVLHSP